MGGEGRPPGQVCPNPDCHLDQRWWGFHGFCCPECACKLVVACSQCDSGAVKRVDGSPRCSDHAPTAVADGGAVEGVTKRMRVPSVLVDCCECSTTFEIDARTFDLAVKVGRGRFRCDECKPDTGDGNDE